MDTALRDDPAAMAWLWKDHTAAAEAREISVAIAAAGLPYLSRCGGAYSSEWFWSKMLRAARTAPAVPAKLCVRYQLSYTSSSTSLGCPRA